MVDVLDPIVAEEVAALEPPAPVAIETPRDWSRHAPLVLVAIAVGFTAWLLRSELRALPYPNDAVTHAGMVRFAEQRIRSGHNPFDAWYPYLGLGSPQFLQYQSLSHVFTGLLSIVFGAGTLRWTNYLLITTWPITVYAGARLLGLDRWQAASAALLSPMLANNMGYGFEWSSFVWLGSGLWSMLWAVWLLPITLGLAWRAVAYRERIALATFVVGLTCALHFIIGFFVLLAFAVFVLVRPQGFVMRIGRAALVGLGGLLTFAFVFGPMFANLRWVNVDSFTAGTFWVDSFGPGRVFDWLVHGQVFDFRRLPVVTVLVGAGAVISLVRIRRSEAARVPLGLMVLSLLLYSGRTVVGPIVNYLPGGANILLHRYVVCVHFAGLLLAGIASTWLIRTAVGAARKVPRLGRHKVFATVTVTVLAAVVLWPVVADRRHVSNLLRAYTAQQAASDRPATRDIDSLLDFVKQRNDGRVYTGGSNGWGPYVRVFQVPLYLLPAQHDTDSVGLYLRTSSLSTDVEPFFTDTDPAEYDLFNVKYVLLPSRQKVPVAGAVLVAQRGEYSLYEVRTSGYLEVVDTTAAIKADNGNIGEVMKRYLPSRAVAQLRHPLVSFDGSATPAPSIDKDAPPTGPAGTVRTTAVDLDNGRFTGRVHADRNAWVMLKESYHPHWTATVDGKPVKTQMLAPSFVGVPVPAGDHVVAFSYRSTSSYPGLVAIGVLTLLTIGVGPRLWRRARRRRPEAATTASSS